MKKQLELDLQRCTDHDTRRYLDKVRANTLRHFLGESHPKTRAAVKKAKP